MDAIHSSEDSVTIVYATNDHRALTRATAVSVVNVLLIEGICLRLKTASDDTSDMISKRQLLVDGDAEASNSAEKINSDPSTTRTDMSMSILGS